MTDSGALAARSATIDCDRVMAALAFIQAYGSSSPTWLPLPATCIFVERPDS
ncbi:MAG: hypothetical protein AAF609_08725 [Cyanobacteria bacterium P01_C01_bin.120]